MLKNERGVALPVVLLTVTVLIIVGMSLLSISANGLKREGYQEKKMQAYYLAKSGANAVAGYIKNHYNYTTFNPGGKVSLVDLNAQLNQDVPLGAGSFKVQVSKVNSTTETLKVVSTGKVNGVQEKATLLLNTTSFKFGKETIFASEAIEGNGNTSIKGNVATNSSLGSSDPISVPDISCFRSDGTIEPDKTKCKEYNANRHYPDAVYPSLASCDNNLISETITADKCYKDTSLNNSDAVTLTISVSGNQDIQVDLTKFNALKGQASLTINVVKADPTKTGKALIYFNTLDTNGGTNFSVTGDANSAVVFFKGKLDAGGHTVFSKVSVYAPNSEILFKGGVDFNGVIIAKKVSLVGHSSADSLNFFAFTESIPQVPAYETGSWGSQ
ncbi:hypothetical protein [Paenibacillus montanisoli]|uniref:hypothetical protein n=1 Tax=Paenibacillus montanisoli TaxID=2081970 RepID=UPI001057E6E9|nr:hypothetical protein [Paenibacillus montanisoli]